MEGEEGVAVKRSATVAASTPSRRKWWNNDGSKGGVMILGCDRGGVLPFGMKKQGGGGDVWWSSGARA